ncbi:hypothetical protein OG618_04670 [Kitasatospora sp. NBC_01246]|uniref:hypothetical protein n=1 Tax=Kitasatospora sp. NBC_01246 TaxID=2903570 RepID=UPI002E32C02C|nr:hypothetical protein [Kitasatospora sp. NBC_01246]
MMTNLPTTVDGLGGLAEEGAIVLAGALATGAFGVARARIAAMFGRLGPNHEAGVETQLDADQELVRDAAPEEQDEVRQDIAPVWRGRLARLLRDCPEVEPELRDLLAALREALPEERRGWVQTIVARDNATVYGAQGGNVIHYQGAHAREVPPPDGAAADGGQAEA